nr:uncharacterized protein LOC127300261 [Lolium perenne]
MLHKHGSPTPNHSNQQSASIFLSSYSTIIHLFISGMSTTDTSSPKDAPVPAPASDAPSAAAAAGEPTVIKTVQTVEVTQSAGQEEGQGTIKPVEIVHEIPADEPAPKQE